jgi:hypothetical protein
MGCVLGVAALGGVASGCLDDTSRLQSGDPSAGSDARDLRILAPFESAGDAGETDVYSVDTCAETANSCLETSEDPAACIRGYVLCAVAAGIEPDHPYLGCVEALATCWETSDELQVVEACVLSYDDCVATYFDSAEPTPTDPIPDEPEAPTGPFAVCDVQAEACLNERPDDLVGCVVGYRDCVAPAGADRALLGCLDSLIVCLDEGADELACFDAFDVCIHYGYPEEPGDTHEEPPPSEEHEWAICEQPTVECYEWGGTNPECLTVYRRCLVDYGLETDDPRILCLDTLINCAARAEASAEPGAALEVCADDFNLCVGAVVLD